MNDNFVISQRIGFGRLGSCGKLDGGGAELPFQWLLQQYPKDGECLCNYIDSRFSLVDAAISHNTICVASASRNGDVFMKDYRPLTCKVQFPLLISRDIAGDHDFADTD